MLLYRVMIFFFGLFLFPFPVLIDFFLVHFMFLALNSGNAYHAHQQQPNQIFKPAKMHKKLILKRVFRELSATKIQNSMKQRLKT
jgi:predicted membrane protein